MPRRICPVQIDARPRRGRFALRRSAAPTLDSSHASVTKFEHATLTSSTPGGRWSSIPVVHRPLGELESVVADRASRTSTPTTGRDHLDRILGTFPGIADLRPRGRGQSRGRVRRHRRASRRRGARSSPFRPWSSSAAVTPLIHESMPGQSTTWACSSTTSSTTPATRTPSPRARGDSLAAPWRAVAQDRRGDGLRAGRRAAARLRHRHDL